MTISAGATRRAGARPLRYRWEVLRGDAGRISITPRSADGAVVDLVIPWHGRGTVPGQPALTSDRIDIGVFADNGAELSAPAFVSVAYPPHQRRTYAPDGTPLEIAYAAPEFAERYADPLVFARMDWTDTYRTDGEGRLLGWTRRGPEGEAQGFTRHGARVLETDALGRPVRAEAMQYRPERDASAAVHLRAEPTGQVFIYRYNGPYDTLGTATPQP
jgi:hypothetical protein